MKYQIFGEKKVSNLPWQDRPEGCMDVVWRYKNNPIINRDIIACSNSVFNSAAVSFGDGFAGVFRVDNKARNMELHAGFSKDGIHWDIDENRIEFETDIEEMKEFTELICKDKLTHLFLNHPRFVDEKTENETREKCEQAGFSGSQKLHLQTNKSYKFDKK